MAGYSHYKNAIRHWFSQLADFIVSSDFHVNRPLGSSQRGSPIRSRLKRKIVAPLIQALACMHLRPSFARRLVSPVAASPVDRPRRSSIPPNPGVSRKTLVRYLTLSPNKKSNE